jgi:hypothetical protein
VRPLALVLAVAAVLAAGASAAEIDPRALVLHQADVPRSFELDRQSSQLIPNPGTGATPDFKALVARSGRVTGYYAAYQSGTREIVSVAEVFRRPAGARIYFKWYEDRLRQQGEGSRTRAAVGDQGWRYRVRSTPRSTFVLWRDGRVVASVLAQNIGSHRTLAVALARKQDRRIAASPAELPKTR